MRVRAGLVAVIYQKALILSNDERGKASGDIVNLMSVDASRLQDLCTYGLMFLSAPFQVTKNVYLTPRENSLNLTTRHFEKVTLAFVSLYNLLGWSAFVGVGIMVFSVPLNTVIANFLKNLQVKQMKSKDKRARLMSELLANVRRYCLCYPAYEGRCFLVLIVLALDLVSSCTLGSMHSSVGCY